MSKKDDFDKLTNDKEEEGFFKKKNYETEPKEYKFEIMESFDEDENLTASEKFMKRKLPLFTQLGLILVILGAIVYTLYSRTSDFLYFFANKTPIDIGAVENPDIDKKAKTNSYVKIVGTSRQQPLKLQSMFTDSRFIDFFGTSKIYAVTPSGPYEAALEKDGLRQNEEFTGRLRYIKDLPEYGEIKRVYFLMTRREIPPQALVVEDSIKPGDKQWVALLFFVLALVGTFSVTRLAVVIRKFKA